jgi:hypothetical protein
MGLGKGTPMLLDEAAETEAYDPKKHRMHTWIYDPVKKKLYPPVFGRPFGNPWALALVGTPHGVYAKSGGNLYHGKVTLSGDTADVAWTLVAEKGPGGHGEAQPIVYDSKRNRLLFVMGRSKGRRRRTLVPEVHAFSLAPDAEKQWVKLAMAGDPVVSREVVYVTKQDALMALSKPMAVMDCTNNMWRRLDTEMPDGGYGVGSMMVYDARHDVAVFWVPRGNWVHPMRVFLFRYDPATAKYRPLPKKTPEEKPPKQPGQGLTPGGLGLDDLL